jgi:hypothetical protein
MPMKASKAATSSAELNGSICRFFWGSKNGLRSEIRVGKLAEYVTQDFLGVPSSSHRL